jgi:hypothetical protein
VTLQLRVATFNIRNSSADDGADSWPMRREATVAAIKGLSADVSHERPDGRLPSDHWPVVADLSS